MDQSNERVIESTGKLLSDRFGQSVKIDELTDLRSSDRSRVIRARVLGDDSGIPSSVIIKQAVGTEEHPYDPDNVAPFSPAERLFNDWAGAEFLTSAFEDAPIAPRFYGGDREVGVVVLEDLGQHKNLADLLLGGNPEVAEAGLLEYAKSMGRMHAGTIGRHEEYQSLRNALAPTSKQEEDGLPYPEFRKACEEFEISFPSDFDAEVASMKAALYEPGQFYAYMHGDPCPDNNFVIDGKVTLLDFEFGSYRNALIDGVYGRILFPTCWCTNRLTLEMSERMEAAYRAELLKGCPEAANDGLFNRAVLDACAHWTLDSVDWHLPHALKEDGEWGVSTNRQRLLIRLAIFTELAEESGEFTTIGVAVGSLAKHLQTLWTDTAPMPEYPAFRSTKNVN